jgi:hypothetical protein
MTSLPCLITSRPSDLSRLDQGDPLGFAQYVPWAAYWIPSLILASLVISLLLQVWLTWLYIYVHSAAHTQYCSLFKYSLSKLLHNWLCLIIAIIVLFSDTGNVFQVFWSCNQLLHSKSWNIIHHKICAWFSLTIQFWRPIATIVGSRDKLNQFLLIGSKWARH